MGGQDDWPFSDPHNLAVITIDRIVEGKRPILFVSHDADDGGWQFLDGEDVDVSVTAARVLSLHELVERDPTIRELADLPIGWQAVRDNADQPWRRLPPE